MTPEDRFERALLEVESATDDLNRGIEAIDRLIKEGVESGIKTGIILGLLDAYGLLVRSGHKKAAEGLKTYIDASYTANGS